MICQLLGLLLLKQEGAAPNEKKEKKRMVGFDSSACAHAGWGVCGGVCVEGVCRVYVGQVLV